MADFVAVIRKAVDSLPNNTPENRAKVYDKARAAIRRQLEAINPPPSDEVIARQLDKLGAAIDEVESDHAEALPADVDETEALMAELESMVEKSPVIAEPKPEPRPEPKPAPRPEPKPEPRPEPKLEPAPEPRPAAPVAAPAAPVRQDPPRATEPAPLDYDDYDDEPAPYEPARKAFVEPGPAWEPEPVSRPADLVGEAHDAAFGLDHARERQTARPVRQQPVQKSGKGGLLAAALVALFVVVVAVAGFIYKDTVVAMFSASPVDTPVGSGVAGGDAPDAADTAPAAEAAAPETAPVETALTEEAVPGEDGKFTQRLNPDGTETDAGPAEGPEADGAVEGRSVAALTDPGPADESVAEETTADAAVAPEDAAAPASQPLGVQQKMILYEERLGQQSLEVKPGTVVWTLVSEQTGDGPDEQVIRGEINNPDKGLSALLTIKRNTDASLPASHIVEIVFALPTDFDGGAIDQLQRIAMKQTEADQGTPLIAVPAKITQDFYMVALNDLEEARKENTELLRNRNWIDIPVVYSNGRQALITLEKGASGTEVFNQALDAWARAGG
ncbi:hypothetical protein [Hoeflea alexandrii]|uniref:hypothetical protein n=1 Tax=Hoeflea alexandrii TaxID=288436 RepID=UPI0022AED58D|nr:hypothetical protein [Hoeflea alexandrii]MCZ4290358.1 hypothetical protein [Hoeflea alexandrii]